jgi:hypothetical protein
MKTNNTAIVITTIQEPTPCMRLLAERALEHGLQWIVVGDRKGPARFSLPPAELLSIDEQKELQFRIAPLLPERHYARKNIGYLVAISRGCDCIYETDDDNAPTDAWHVRTLETQARQVRRRADVRWANVYEAYTTELIWPRGLPLNRARRRFSEDFELPSTLVRVKAPIQQGLANGSPDVDAVWRLILDHEITFKDARSILLPRGVWCPFNSQNTWWWKDAFPLLYLPSYCSFRMTDIWRSFIAQRCLWELDYELEFHRADVEQTRNEHDLMRDFDQETVGYLRNEEIREVLESCDLSSGPSHITDNLWDCYEALVRSGVMRDQELDLLDPWIQDCGTAGSRATSNRECIKPDSIGLEDSDRLPGSSPRIYSGT